MTLKIRRFLFYSLFIAFVFASLIVIFYSQGWRFNLKTFTLQKTGALYVKTQPQGVKIEIDGKLFDDYSGIVKPGTLITDLLPSSYEVKIEKSGYFPYLKNLTVKPALVTELIDVILIPAEIVQATAFPLKLKGDRIEDLDEENKKIIIKNKNYYLYNLNDSKTTLNISAVFNNLKTTEMTAIKKISFHPFDNNRLILETTAGLEILDTKRLKLNEIFEDTKNNKLTAWTIKNSNIYYITKTQNYQFFSFNLITKLKTLLLDLPITDITDSENIINQIKTSPSGVNIAFLDTLDDLYLFNLQNKEPKKIAHNSRHFSFSPDSKKIAFLDKDGKFNIYFLEGKTISFNLRNKEQIRDIHWYEDSSHLFIKYSADQNIIDFIEIDDRPPLNQYPIIKDIQDFYYDWESNILYFIQNQKLFTILPI